MPISLTVTTSLESEQATNIKKKKKQSEKQLKRAWKRHWEGSRGRTVFCFYILYFQIIFQAGNVHESASLSAIWKSRDLENLIYHANYQTTADLTDREEIILVHRASTPTQKKNLTSLETVLKGAVSRNSAELGNYKMPVKLKET